MSGGISGTHTLHVDHLLRAGPTTEDKHNTYRMALVPLACWHIKDVRFEFDSSFVLPDAADELQMLAKLRAEHPGAPISVFGHADPVGNDQYNKELSGRRAIAVYAMLIRREAMWEELYKKPHSMGGDVWGQKSIHRMQDALGQPHSPVSKPVDRAILFRAYMDLVCGEMVLTPGDFLARGADPDGKGDYQGCGEFNPLLVFSKKETADLDKNHKKRNEENAPNRRVLAYLFRPGSVVSPDKWPCPRAKEDTAGCTKRLWSDEKVRRNPSGDRREFEETKDTFGCRFYHRIAVESPCERAKALVFFIKDLRFEPEKAFCGDKVKLLATTNLPDGTAVRFQLKAKQGSSTLKPLDVMPAGGQLSHEFEVKDVDFKNGSSFFDKVVIEATVDPASPAKALVDPGSKPLTVEALLDAPDEEFSEHRTWSGFGNDSKFLMKIDKFKAKVHPEFKIMKVWGAYMVDLNTFGITGTATNGPGGSGWRWARVTGSNTFMPDQYHDGTRWKALPAGFKAAADANAVLYTAIGLIKNGAQFVPKQPNTGGPFPTTFTDYNFDDPKLVAKRDKWVKTSHDKWSAVWQLRRKDCHSGNAVRCCRYDVEVDVKLTTVTVDGADVIGVGREAFRSNAGTFFMGDTRDTLLAHEAGHHMDNPDEYTGGAVDPAMSGDGAVAGIDKDSIMGQNHTKVKKRHYHAFPELMKKKSIKNKYGRDYDYLVVDKV